MSPMSKLMIVIGVLVFGWLVYLYFGWINHIDVPYYASPSRTAVYTNGRIDSLIIILKRIENKLDER